MILTHPSIEMLTHPRGGAVQIVRFCSRAVFNEFCARHMMRRKVGSWNSLELVYLKHEDAHEEVLVVYGAEPELHIHGGESNWESLVLKLNALSRDEDAINHVTTRDWRRLWEKTFREIRGEKGIAYMLELLKQNELNVGKVGQNTNININININANINTDIKNSREYRHGNHTDNYDQEGFEYLRPIKVCLVGPPNAGKSTFFNELLGENRALVSHLAGTTRDLIQASVVMGGFEVHITDTAGFDPEVTLNEMTEVSQTISSNRDPKPDDDILKQSVQLARDCLAQSDIVLAFRCRLPENLVASNKVLAVYSKCEDGGAQSDQWAISVHQRKGVSELIDELKRRVESLKGVCISPKFCRNV